MVVTLFEVVVSVVPENRRPMQTTENGDWRLTLMTSPISNLMKKSFSIMPSSRCRCKKKVLPTVLADRAIHVITLSELVR